MNFNTISFFIFFALVTRFAAPLLFVRIFLVFHLVCLAWVFFRAQNVSQALDLIGVMSNLADIVPTAMPSRHTGRSCYS